MWQTIKQKTKSTWDWVKKKVKRFWKWLLIGSIAVATTGVVMEGSPTISEQEVITAIEQRQNAYFQQHGKYEQGFKSDDWKGKLLTSQNIPFTIQIDEFQHPNDQYGYRILLENDKFIKSIGYGPHAKMWTHEVIKLPPTTTTTTTTTTL